jgi:hypothetical protein
LKVQTFRVFLLLLGWLEDHYMVDYGLNSLLQSNENKS